MKNFKTQFKQIFDSCLNSFMGQYLFQSVHNLVLRSFMWIYKTEQRENTIFVLMKAIFLAVFHAAPTHLIFDRNPEAKLSSKSCKYAYKSIYNVVLIINALLRFSITHTHIGIYKAVRSDSGWAQISYAASFLLAHCYSTKYTPKQKWITTRNAGKRQGTRLMSFYHVYVRTYIQQIYINIYIFIHTYICIAGFALEKACFWPPVVRSGEGMLGGGSGV